MSYKDIPEDTIEALVFNVIQSTDWNWISQTEIEDSFEGLNKRQIRAAIHNLRCTYYVPIISSRLGYMFETNKDVLFLEALAWEKKAKSAVKSYNHTAKAFKEMANKTGKLL